MSDDYVYQEDLDEAIIKDTCHCQCCGASYVLGGNDDILVEVPQINGRVAQLALCIECAEEVHKAYRTFLRESGICEHGVSEGQFCRECREEYRRAYKDHFQTEDGMA